MVCQRINDDEPAEIADIISSVSGAGQLLSALQGVTNEYGKGFLERALSEAGLDGKKYPISTLSKARLREIIGKLSEFILRTVRQYEGQSQDIGNSQ